MSVETEVPECDACEKPEACEAACWCREYDVPLLGTITARALRAEAALRDIRSILDAYSDDDGPGASLVALGKIGNRLYREVTGV